MSPSTALRLIGHLASHRLQQRFIVEGTSESYVLIDEVLENAYTLLRHPLLSQDLDTASFKSALDSVSIGESEENANIVNANPTWATLRREAQRLLQELGADLNSFEDKELA